jgi:hypothetical protein
MAVLLQPFLATDAKAFCAQADEDREDSWGPASGMYMVVELLPAARANEQLLHFFTSSLW